MSNSATTYLIANMQWLFVLLLAVAQISTIFASCVMDDELRKKIVDRHEKFHPTTDRPVRAQTIYPC
ncbi:hypothetical protein Y032_0387g481 [Ancylostoma ceylanicum]|uniref:Uncharacterized protein n=1 Tax=Ancylostoma ceylanicum TaxID=53326 RepID=A0A016RT77_9BILA|nr:hypothetical protein Y032_0387g481 [Ancylostoma ceylanicum]